MGGVLISFCFLSFTIYKREIFAKITRDPREIILGWDPLVCYLGGLQHGASEAAESRRCTVTTLHELRYRDRNDVPPPHSPPSLFLSQEFVCSLPDPIRTCPTVSCRTRAGPAAPYPGGRGTHAPRFPRSPPPDFYHHPPAFSHAGTPNQPLPSPSLRSGVCGKQWTAMDHSVLVLECRREVRAFPSP